MIDTLLFDLDNTLLDFDKAEANAITRALGDVGISVTNEMRDCYHKINLAQWKLLVQGKMTREEVKMRRFKLLFQEFDIKASPQEVAKHYQDYLGQGHYFIEGAEEVLQELSKRFRIYLVTNGINAGIKTIWFHRAQDLTEDPQPKPDYEINSLKSLLKMLK